MQRAYNIYWLCEQTGHWIKECKEPHISCWAPYCNLWWDHLNFYMQECPFLRQPIGKWGSTAIVSGTLLSLVLWLVSHQYHLMCCIVLLSHHLHHCYLMHFITITLSPMHLISITLRALLPSLYMPCFYHSASLCQGYSGPLSYWNIEKLTMCFFKWSVKLNTLFENRTEIAIERSNNIVWLNQWTLLGLGQVPVYHYSK